MLALMIFGAGVLYEYLGSDCFIYVSCEGLGVITVRVDDKVTYQTGDRVSLSFEKKRLHFFDQDGASCR